MRSVDKENECAHYMRINNDYVKIWFDIVVIVQGGNSY